MDVPIVQGTAVPVGGGDADDGNKYDGSHSHSNSNSHSNNDHHDGQRQSEFSYLNEAEAEASYSPGRPELQQPMGYRDVFWAVLFVFHLIAMVAIIAVNMGAGAAAAANGNGGVADTDYSGVCYLVGITAASTIALGSATLRFMMKYPAELVKGSLIVTVGLSGVIAAMALLSGQAFAGIILTVFFAIGICYAKAVWPRIPFAAANLNTALTAVKSNMGVTVIAYGMILLAFG